MRTWIAGSWLAMALAATAPPAGAEPRGAAPEGPVDLGVEMGFGAEGFRLGGRFTGPAGVYRLWLGGRPRSNGFTLEGGLEEGGLSRGFTFDARVTPWGRGHPEPGRTGPGLHSLERM
jgi:hypothetical protein